MTARERARNLLNALSRVDDPLARTAYLERYISLYLKLYPDARNLSRVELEAKAWELLQKLAAGDVEIAEEELDKSAVHPELLKYLVEAEEKGQIEPSRQYDIRRLFLQIKQEETQKEDLTKALDAQNVDRPQDVAENIAETAKRLNEAQLEVGEKGIVNLVRKAGEEVGVFISEEKGEKIAETLSASPLFRPVLADTGYQAPPTGRLRPTVQAQEQAAKPAEEQPTPGPKLAFPSEKQILYAAARARKISLFGRIFKSLPIIGKSEEQILKDQLNVYNQAIARLTRLDPQRYSPTSPIITLLQKEREKILGEILQKGEVLKELEFAPSESLEQFLHGFSKKGLRLHKFSLYLRTSTHEISPTTFREIFKQPFTPVFPLPRKLPFGRVFKNISSTIARKLSPLFRNPWTYFFSGLASAFTGVFLPLPNVLKLPLILGGAAVAGGSSTRIPGLGFLPRLFARGSAARIGAFLAAALPSAAVIAKLAGISLIIAFASVGVASFIHLAKNRAVVYEELGVGGVVGPPGVNAPDAILVQNIGFAFPVRTGQICTTSPHGDIRADGQHFGTDFKAPLGTPIYPIADGRVVRIGKERGRFNQRFGPYGIYVVILTEGEKDGETVPIYHLYAHLLRVALPVSAGETVTKDTIIGWADDTGNSDGSHLHLSVSNKCGTTVPDCFYPSPDPCSYLECPERCP